MLEATGPFLFAALLLIAGSIVGKTASARAIERYGKELEKLPKKERTIGLAPETVSNLIDWTTDATQILGIFVGPLLGLILLGGDVGLPIVFGYIVLLSTAFLATLKFVTKGDAVNYWEKPLGPVIRHKMRGVKSWRSLSPMTIVGVAINVFAAAVAAALTLWA